MRGYHFVRKDHTPRFHHLYELVQSLIFTVNPDECCEVCDDVTVPAVALVGYNDEGDVWKQLPTCFQHITKPIDDYHHDENGQIADVMVYADVDLVTGKWVEELADAS